VLSAGGGRFVGFPQIDQLSAEIYSPPYLFKGARPVITSAPATVQYGTSFFVGTGNPAGIARVTMLAPGAVTHSVNMHQRFLGLSFQQAAGGLDVAMPANANLAPPGYYMLFLIDSNGVPSVASFVQVAAAVGANPVPVSTSLNPTSATAGGAAFTLTVNGSNFINGSVVRWNGANRTTTFVSATQLTAAITAADIATAGTAQVTVFNPAPGGGTSNAQTFTITTASTTTTVTFDNPVPSGNSGSFLNGVFQGINFGTNRWRWETAFGPNPTRYIYFNSASGTSRTFTFSPGPRTLVSINVFTGTAGTLTLTDNLGQTRTQAITTGSMQLVTTGWTQPSTTVTVNFTAGRNLGVDDIVYQ
jgi:hypothetical protein